MRRQVVQMLHEQQLLLLLLQLRNFCGMTRFSALFFSFRQTVAILEKTQE